MTNEFLKNYVPLRFPGERIWVIRASGGRYVEHFRKENIVAIGHIDGYKFQVEPNKIELSEIKKFIGMPKTDGASLNKASISNLANQVSNFISEIRPNDLVLTIDDRSVAIGRAKGEAYFDSEPVEITKLKRSIKMHYELRRKVEWGPVFKRSEFPYSMELSLRAHQAVFNIDSHWSNLYHCLYPIFRDESHVYFSTNIKQHNDIDSHSIAQLFATFSDLEALAKTFDPNIEETLSELLRRFSNESSYELSCKAEFMSPGHVWAKLGMTKIEGKRLLYFLIAYGCLFGHIKAWEFQIEGIVTKEIREKIADYVLESIKSRELDKVNERLQLDVPKYNTKPLQIEKVDEPILIA